MPKQPLRILSSPTRMLFFTGKGGVGKTSLACATAVALADQGRSVLLISTDPASNLDQVFGVAIGDQTPTAIATVPGLKALNINPEAAAQAYRERIVGPVRELLPPETIRVMEEQLSGACTTEIAAFDEFTSLLTDPHTTEKYDHLIFDTAPTGHTLRLLQLPTAWTSFLKDHPSGAACLGPLSGLEKQQHQYASAVSQLSNGQTTTMVLVARPQVAALSEANRTSHELSALGIVNQRFIINGIMPDIGSLDPLSLALQQRETQAMQAIPEPLASLPQDRVELQPTNMVGVAALRGLVTQKPSASNLPTATLPDSQDWPDLRPLIDDIERDQHGLIMVLGKGGVGKTTVAAAIAVALAVRGHEVHLTTTDPAAHLSMTVESTLPHLTVSRIDPQIERENYRHHVLATQGAQLDAEGRSLLEEDLRSPCTEEIAVFQAFSKVLYESRQKFVVVDTAPTGHTLLLLDATGAYHRDVIRHMQPELQAITPLMRLQDPKQTKMLIVTLPETTPILEAEMLQAELRRAGIEPWAWVINSSLAASSPKNPLLVARALQELPHLAQVRKSISRVAILPLQPHEPIGSRQLLAFAKITSANQLEIPD